MDIPADAQYSEDGAWWWDGVQWQAVSNTDTGAGGAGNTGGYGDSYGQGGYGGQGGVEGGPGEGSHSEVAELILEHGAVHVVDTIVHGVFHIAEGAFTLAVLVLEIALGPGDTAMHATTVRRYAASCDGDHGGVSWQGPYREYDNEAADDILRHNYEWPGHAAGATTDEQLVH